MLLMLPSDSPCRSCILSDHKGISFLVVPRSEGLSTKQMKMQGGKGSGTTLLEMDEVKVPGETLRLTAERELLSTNNATARSRELGRQGGRGFQVHCKRSPSVTFLHPSPALTLFTFG